MCQSNSDAQKLSIRKPSARGLAGLKNIEAYRNDREKRIRMCRELGHKLKGDHCSRCNLPKELFQ